jgi:tetratricopeptide (TPR) repeat protein
MSAAQAVVVPADDLERITKIYDQGLYLQAYHAAEAIGPLSQWTGTTQRILAGRIAGNLGSQRLADVMFIRAFRADSKSCEASWYYTRYLLDARGPFQALQVLKKQGLFPEAPPDQRSFWLSLWATVHGRVRDFDNAEKWLAEAESLGWQHPWIHLERAALFNLEDRHEEALQAVRRALEVRPWYRPAVQWLAHFLVQLERDEEALTTLQEAMQRLESCAVASQLAGLLMELKRYEEARAVLEECARLAPLQDKFFSEWLSARRSETAYFCGDLATARDHAAKVKGRFFEAQVKRFENPPPPEERRRVVLNVGFVRQHHQTCVPATLTAICRFWNMPGAHLEVADKITYAGTPNHSERQWAIDNGWETREFTVTWEAATALLDRGIPFTLTTPEVSSSLLQAAIGYDNVRGTLVIRDPGERHQAEFLVEGLQERYAATGPRGMALVPGDKAALLAEIHLPDAELFDLQFQVDKALESHQRTRAAQLIEQMTSQAPKHRLTLSAARTLAVYDNDPARILAANEALLEQYPEDLRLLLSKVSCLRDLARRDDYLQLLERLSAQKKTDPACWQQLAHELADDAREQPRACYFLRRAFRANPMDPRTYFTLARIQWDRRAFEQALELYRMATCLEDKDEHLARTYFSAANCLGKVEEALGFLQRRFERFGDKSGHPARTYSWALFQLERGPQAFGILDLGLERRPEDGELMLYAVDQRIQNGAFVKAKELLQRAKGKTQETYWLRSVALLAQTQGDLENARRIWKKILEVEPLNDNAHRAYAQALAETRGRAAALEHLRQTVERFPHNFAFNQILVDWSQEEGPQAIEPIVRRLIDIHPANAWARRELAMVLTDQGRVEEAAQELEVAYRLEPSAVTYWTVKAYLHHRTGDIPAAKECFRQALTISVDTELAIQEWLQDCESDVERREALSFIKEQLVKQRITGGGLLTYRDFARHTLSKEELLASLRQALETRPDLWHAWSAVIRQLRENEQLAEALEVAREAVERFPLLPALWVDLGEVHQERGDDESAIKSFKRALKINHEWHVPLRLLADLYQRREQADQARSLLERAIARSPLNGANQFTLALLLWNTGEREKALQRCRQVITLEPGYEFAWEHFCDWAAQLEKYDAVVDFARTLTKKRPGEARSWMRLAQALSGMPPQPGDDVAARVDESLQALRQVHQLNPRLVDAYDLEARLLSEQGRFAEAETALNAPHWNGRVPINLRGRLAWLLAQQGNVPEAIASMETIVQDDPAYYWAWSNLAEWYERTQHFQEYLTAAQNMVRLAPHLPVPWAFQGEAKLLLGNRRGGKRDLRKARDIDPGYAFASLRLFDEEMADDDIKLARATIKVIQREVRDDFGKARVVQWFARRGQRAKARKAFCRLCVSHQTATWPLETAARAFDEQGWQSLVNAIFRRAVQRDHWNPNVALLWTERFNPEMDEDLEERLAALDQALPALEDKVRALDLKAERLTETGRFAEALKACDGLKPDQPTPLRGRKAWVQHQAGDHDKAVRAMKKILKEDADYYWGWSKLAEWLEMAGDHAGHLQAAERLVELGPDNPFAYIHRAEAFRALNDADSAAADYTKAHELDAHLPYPAMQLFDLHLAAGRFSAARKILKVLHETAPPFAAKERAMRLALAQDNQEQVLKKFGELLKVADKQELATVLTTLDEAGLSQKAEAVLISHLQEGDVPEAWIALAHRQGRLKEVAEKIDRLPTNHVGKVPAVVAYAVHLGKAKEQKKLRSWVKKHEKFLRDDTPVWGQVGHAFSSCLDDAATADWLRDWKERPEAQPWMLINLALALRGLDRFPEANAVQQYAVTQLEADFTTPFQETWLMLDGALAGDAAVVRDYFERTDVADLDPNHRWIAALAQALLWCLTGRDKAKAFAKARDHLKEVAQNLEPIDRDECFILAYRKTIKEMSRRCGGLGGGFWRLWRSFKPVLPKRKEAVEV